MNFNHKSGLLFILPLIVAHTLPVGAQTANLMAPSPPVAANTLIQNGPRSSLSLNGTWQVLPIHGLTFQYPPAQEGWKDEKVPESASSVINTINGPWMTSGPMLTNADGTVFKQTDKMAAWYRRDFEISGSALAGKRALLHFEGMAFKSQTWLNGSLLGTSVLGQVPVDYDVTDELKPGLNHLVAGLAGREAIYDLADKSYIAPFGGVVAGIWGNVELRLLPEVSLRDIFVKTFVGEKRIEVETTIQNASNSARAVTPSATICDERGNAQTQIIGDRMTLAPGQETTVTLHQNWLAPHLWTPQTPSLYSAHVQLHADGAFIDAQTQRFGFREFDIHGRDFYLNGVRTVLLRDSHYLQLSTGPEAAFEAIRHDLDRPFNTGRLQYGFDNTRAMDAADQLGLILTPELAWYSTTITFPVERSDVWLSNVLAYERAFIKLNRNHPSIMIWNLTNETFWGRTEAASMKIADQVLAVARAGDPTRPQEADGDCDWGGRLPIISLHYPEVTAGALLERYPNSGILDPNTLDWLSQHEVNTAKGYGYQFNWDRPLVIGEYFFLTDNPDTLSSFMGESVYDFDKWRHQDMDGRDDKVDNKYLECVERATDIYRAQGVAGLNPWAGDRNLVMPQLAVRPLDYHPNYFGGSTGTRRVVVFNDSGRPYPTLKLDCCLTVGGATVWQKNIPTSADSGTHPVLDVPIAFPVVTTQTPATLTITMSYPYGPGWAEFSHYQEQLYILPPERATPEDGRGLVLLDANGATDTALRKLGLDLTAKTSLTADDLVNATTLIVGSDTDATPYRALIDGFVRRGGRALLLNQPGGAALTSDLAQTDDKHVATRVWKRTYNHPILAGLDDAQFSFWQPDNLVSTRTLQKPSVGNCKILLDAGGLYGLHWTPLLETVHGDGIFLQCQLNLTDRVDVEPLAGHLLLAMLRYCRDYRPKSTAPLRTLIGGNDALKDALKACSVVTSAGLVGGGPVLLDASYSPSAVEIEQLKAYLASGGKLWLHGFSDANIATVAPLFPFQPQLEPYDKTIQGAARRSDDPLMNNLSSHDLAWTRVDLSASSSDLDYFAKAQPTAKLGGAVLALPSLDAGQKLIEPGLLVKVPVGAGTILFDNLLWENALGAETDKVARLVDALALNLGGDVRIAPEKTYDYFQADLAPFANMGYYDEVAGDGKGGWTDQGINDMRYFLINHSGKANGMDVGVGAFPTTATFADRPFRLVEPKANNGRAVITLRGQQHDPTLPAQATGIPVGHRADKLWFLQAACWAIDNTMHQEIGRYIIHYSDGSEAIFPLRYGLELSDWWDPRPLPNARVAWTGKNDMHAPIGIYATEWTNPEPAKTIASIDLVGNETGTQIVLLAITGGVESQGGANAGRVIADWNFGAARDGMVPNAIGQGALHFGAIAPVPIGQGDDAGLHFAHGASLVAATGAIPGLAGGGPLMLRVTVQPDAPPDGYYGGIYQSFEYGKCGFRLCLNQKLLPVVELFPAAGQDRQLVGKTRLSPGRFYHLEVRFEAQHAYLMVDGKLDASLDTAPPAPYQGEIEVGVTGGTNYYFNGSIGRITLSVPGH